MLFFQWISWFWTYFGSKNDSNYFKFRLFLNKIIVMEVWNEFSYMNKTHISVKIRKIFWNYLNKPLVSDFWDKKYRTCHRDLYSLLQLCDSNLFIFFESVSTVTVTVQFHYMYCNSEVQCHTLIHTVIRLFHIAAISSEILEVVLKTLIWS